MYAYEGLLNAVGLLLPRPRIHLIYTHALTHSHLIQNLLSLPLSLFLFLFLSLSLSLSRFTHTHTHTNTHNTYIDKCV